MPAPRRASSTPSGLLAAALLLAPALWLFAGPLWQNEAPAFRDTADYYLPLWARAQAEWNAGRIPWFNPWENGGQPLAGDVTAAAFYPGRLLFCLPLSFARTLMLFLMLHILLAAFGAAAAARMLGASREASWIAGPVFAYSGYVLAQHANAVYLVGAAWLPWAAAAGWLLVRRRRLAAIPLLAGPLAMMILGGDPQTAANLVLLLMLAIIAVYLPHSKRKMLSGEAALPSKSGLFLRPIQALAAFGLAGATCGLLAAVQLAPTAAIGPQAGRSYYTHPRSIWGPQHAQVAGAEERTWWNPPRAGEHADSLYDFSLPPWLLAEFALPNAAGRMIPENHRWTSALPFSDRVWAMSLYLGLPALWLAWIGFLPFRGSAASRWLAWGAVLSAVASFGWYGLGWLTGEGLAALGQEAAADKLDPADSTGCWFGSFRAMCCSDTRRNCFCSPRSASPYSPRGDTTD